MFDIQGTSDKGYKRENEVYEELELLVKNNRMPDKQVQELAGLQEPADNKYGLGYYNVEYRYKNLYKKIAKRNGYLTHNDKFDLVLNQIKREVFQ